MFDSLTVSLNSVIPMFVLIGLGYICRLRKMIDEPELKRFNHVAFCVFLPCQLFKNVYDSDFRGVFDFRLLAYSLLCVGIVYLCAVLSVRRMQQSGSRKGVIIQAIFRSNFALLGLPLAQALLGDDLGPVPLMVGIVVAVFNVLAVITLEVYCGQSRMKPGSLLWGIIKNPLIIGSVAGLLCRAMHLDIYRIQIVKTSLTYLAQAATPVMLFILGALFHTSSLSINRRAIIYCIGIRLAVVPLAVISVGIALGFRDVALVTLLGAFATPPAANSYTMALQMGGDADLAGNLVVVGTAFSCLTLFIWIVVLSQLHLL